MTDEAIEAACKEMHKPDPIDEANPYVIAVGWDQLNENYKKQYRELMRAAIAAYEQAMWRREEITDGALLHLIDGEVWYRPLPPPPGKEIIDGSPS